MGHERILAGEICCILWDKSIVFLWLNIVVFNKIFVILVRCLFKDGVYARAVFVLKKTETYFSACLKIYFSYGSQFHNLHVNTTAIHKVNKDILNKLSLHQSWYIRKDLCLVPSKFPTAIEALVTVCFLSLLFK